MSAFVPIVATGLSGEVVSVESTVVVKVDVVSAAVLVWYRLMT